MPCIGHKVIILKEGEGVYLSNIKKLYKTGDDVNKVDFSTCGYWFNDFNSKKEDFYSLVCFFQDCLFLGYFIEEQYINCVKILSKEEMIIKDIIE